MKKKGFTLIELLIVTVVIVTLMGVIFRLAGVGSDSRRRAITIRRMQCLENCLSGYYAAYGSYPPVPLQGRSRSIYTRVDTFGIQSGGNESHDNLSSSTMRKRIHSACRAQPVAALFPPPKWGNWQRSMEKLSEGCTYYYGKTTKYKKSFGIIKNAGGINVENTNWGDSSQGGDSVQLFQFGLMSFLLPRYFFMFSGDAGFYKSNGGKTQWGVNNQLPSRLDTGVPFASWDEIRSIMGGNNDGRVTSQDAGMISNLTSQSVCARWMPNLQGIVTGGDTFYGVSTACNENDDQYFRIPHGFTGDGIEYGELHIFGRNGFAGEGGSGGDLYILNCMTVRDGWHMDYYYYSEPPYQSYRLWSAGPNRLTFPPWYDISNFSSSEITTIKSYTGDDFVHLSN